VKYKITILIDKTTPVKYKITTLIDKTTPVKYKITTLIDKTTPMKYKITILIDKSIQRCSRRVYRLLKGAKISISTNRNVNKL
jgi:ATP-dependent Clp protease adapter protein ClpS